jgi:hypothetical protein
MMRGVSLAFLLASAVRGLVPMLRSPGVDLHRARWMRADAARRRITGNSLRVASDRCLRSRLDEDDDAPAAADVVDAPASDADFGGAVINAVTAVLGVAVAISTVCNLAGYGFKQTEEGLYFGTIQQTRMRYQLDHEVAR